MSRPPQPERGSEHQDLLATDREGLPALLVRLPEGDLFVLALADRQRLAQNGTYVNGGRVNGRQRLAGGDVIRIGTTLIAFRHKQPATDATTARAADAITPEQVTPMQMKVLHALCGPYKNGSSFDAPATNRQIADELQLSPEAVKTHMRGLFERFEVGDLPQNQKRARVVELAMSAGLVRPGEL